MKKLSSILKALMAEVRINESELARRTGIGQPVIHRVASGETDNPKVGTLSPIANFFAISISQLIGDEPLPPNRIPGTFNPSVHNWKQIPLLEWTQLLEWPNIQERTKPLHSISVDYNLSQHAYALTVRDTTMEGRFPVGTTLIVDPAIQPQDRDFVIVHIDGQKTPTFKQILIDGDLMYLKPLNADFKTVAIDTTYKFLGVVVQTRMNLHKY